MIIIRYSGMMETARWRRMANLTTLALGWISFTGQHRSHHFAQTDSDFTIWLGMSGSSLGISGRVGTGFAAEVGGITAPPKATPRWTLATIKRSSATITGLTCSRSSWGYAWCRKSSAEEGDAPGLFSWSLGNLSLNHHADAGYLGVAMDAHSTPVTLTSSKSKLDCAPSAPGMTTILPT